VLWNPIQTPYALLARDCGALVLQNVAVLSRTEQDSLRKWVDDSDPRRQVISTSARPLFPLVARGLFDEGLYYRLNLMLVRLGPAANGGPIARAPLGLSDR
jgi:transcriptional regulator of aromatic amino acid metabolism